jgi:arylsulfatase A-like enzyme
LECLGFGDCSYKNVTYPSVEFGPMIPTPNIDELALGGVRLESYYVTQLCSPTRTSLLSGRYPYTIGMNDEVITDGNPDIMPLTLKTIADHLQEAGWATSAYGKWDAGMSDGQTQYFDNLKAWL